MPIHDPENTALILNTVKNLRPISLLDLGCGSGSYGVLFRDILDRMRQRYKPIDWRVQIDAVDIWSEYFTPIHEYIYDVFAIFDIRKVSDGEWPSELLDVYDVIFAGDVIEHLPKEIGRDVLYKLREHAKAIVVSTPVKPYEQGAYQGNVHEAHLSVWEPEDFTGLGYTVLTKGPEHLLITAVWCA